MAQIQINMTEICIYDVLYGLYRNIMLYDLYAWGEVQQVKKKKKIA